MLKREVSIILCANYWSGTTQKEHQYSYRHHHGKKTSSKQPTKGRHKSAKDSITFLQNEFADVIKNGH